MDEKLPTALRTAADPAAPLPERSAALETLRRAPAPEALPVAAAALAVPELREGAIHVLEALGSDESRAALLDHLERQSAPPGYHELAALSDLGWRTPWPLEQARRAAAVLRRVFELGPGGAPVESLSTATLSLSELKAVARLPEEDRAALARSLERLVLDPDPDGPVMHRYGGLCAMQTLNTPAAVPILERCLALPFEQEVEKAREVLLRLELPEARKAVIAHGLRGAVLGPLAGFVALNLTGVGAVAALLHYPFATPWPWAIGIGAVAAALPAAACLTSYAKAWRRSDLRVFGFLYSLFTPLVLGPGAAVCLEAYRDWGWAGHLLAAALSLAAVLNLLVFLVRAGAASAG